MKAAKTTRTKTSTKQQHPTFHSGLLTKPEAKKALEARDQIALDRYAEELKAKREEVLALDDFIFEVLARPAIKAMSKPGAAVVRTLITEKGMTPFTAARHFAEFKLVCYQGAAL